MSSHNDSLAASGSSPTESGPDFHCENHGSIFLLYPLSQSAKSWILSPDEKRYRFVDTQTREEAKTLLLRVQQGYPSNPELQGLKMGTRFTWKYHKHLADTIFKYLQKPL